MENPVKDIRWQGRIALLGLPNAGKSTLLNLLAGEKLSIVTHKAQTTRMPVRARIAYGKTLMLFVDTPGLGAGRHGGKYMTRALHHAAWSEVDEADCVLFLIDAARASGREQASKLLRLALERNPRLVIALNKIDLLAKTRLPEIARHYAGCAPDARLFMISARTGSGAADLQNYLASLMPEAVAKNDLAGEETPLSTRLAEITREKIYLRVHQEIPYQTEILTEKMEKFHNGDWRIQQMIKVRRAGHKAILIGRHGQTLRAIGEAARLEMEKSVQAKVHLFLQVRSVE